jgi:hypothetical protein
VAWQARDRDVAFAWQGSRAACGRRSHALKNPKLTHGEASSLFRRLSGEPKIFAGNQEIAGYQ